VESRGNLYLSTPADANLYAELRKSTMEPNTARQRYGVSSNNGVIAARPADRLKLVNADDKHESISSQQDLTLIENSMYKNSAECPKPVRNSYAPGIFLMFH